MILSKQNQIQNQKRAQEKKSSKHYVIKPLKKKIKAKTHRAKTKMKTSTQ